MKAFFAIMKQTMRSATRSKVFHVLFALIILAVFFLPMTVSGDGTAKGLVQISLIYSLNVVVALISTTTLWLACSLLSREIEAYNMHMVVCKPCPRWLIWLGKWAGVFLMHLVILLISCMIIYFLILWRVSRTKFSAQERQRLKMETLVGRRTFYPEPINLGQRIEQEYQRRLESGSIAGQHNAQAVKAEIRRTLIAQEGEVKPGDQKTWVYRNVKTSSPDDVLYLRYRMYSGDTSDTNQMLIPCFWGFLIPAEKGKTNEPFAMMNLRIPGGTYQEIPVAAAQVVDRELDHQVVVRFINLPQEFWGQGQAASAVFQAKDRPVILCKVTGFLNNYLRSLVLAIFQIAFLAALGCTVGAAFSTPVAAFAAIAYLVIGLSVQAAVSAPLRNADGSFQYKGITDKAVHKFAQLVSVIVVSVDDLDATSDLTKGNLVEFRRIGGAFLSLVLIRTGIISGIGIWILTRRELGTVIKR